MQLINRTALLADVFVAGDVETRDHAVVVLKGTFTVDARGEVRIAPTQTPFVFADEYAGAPGLSSVVYECDFVLGKPGVDVLVLATAHAPSHKPLQYVDVAIRVGRLMKVIRVFGDRVWESDSPFSFRPSTPEPFVTMPIVYERAFGGRDPLDGTGEPSATDMRNPVGVGFHSRRRAASVAGSRLPNLELPGALIRRWDDRPPPAGFGPLGRNWQPRITRAGTYDARWVAERFPFLPLDFDRRYFQSAPEDQQYGELAGGEDVRCLNLTPEGEWGFRLPVHKLSVAFVFRDRVQLVQPRIDTLIVEPDERRFILVWRGAVPVGRKIHDLRQIVAGDLSTGLVESLKRGKRFFPSVGTLVEWKKRYVLMR